MKRNGFLIAVFVLAIVNITLFNGITYQNALLRNNITQINEKYAQMENVMHQINEYEKQINEIAGYIDRDIELIDNSFNIYSSLAKNGSDSQNDYLKYIQLISSDTEYADIIEELTSLMAEEIDSPEKSQRFLELYIKKEKKEESFICEFTTLAPFVKKNKNNHFVK